jgi:hypothetical protein
MVFKPESSPRPSFLIRVMPYIGMFLLALLLWLPFGFKTTGTYEEWILNDISETEQPPFFIMPSSQSLALNSSRPLQMFFFAASYVLDPNSHLYYNVFQMLFFFGKMVVVYWLVLQFLPEHKLLAFIVGLLYIIYPADLGPFALRTIHIHSAILAFLFAVYLLIQYQKQHQSIAWMALLGSSLFLIVSMWQYKVVLAAAAVAPLVMLYFARPNRRFLLGVGVWYGALAFTIIYTFWADSHSNVITYEGAAITSSSFTLENIRSMFDALLLGYQRQFTGWSDAVAKLDYTSVYGPYLLAGLAITVVLGAWLLHQQNRERTQPPISWQRYVLLFVSAVVMFAVGMAVYLPLPSYRFLDFRIYYLATFGSAASLGLGLYFISRIMPRYRETIFLLLTLPFIGLAFLNAFEMHQRYVNLSLVEQNLLQQTVTQAPQIKPETFILVIDNSTFKELYDVDIFAHNTVLPMALRYVYSNRNIDGQYCPPTDRAVLNTECQFRSDALHIINYLYYSGVYLRITPDLAIPYDRLLLFTYEDDGNLKLMTSEQAAATFKIAGYNPQARIVSSAMPYRAQTIFSCVPALSCYQAAPILPRSSFDLPDMGKIGSGWRASEFDGVNSTFRWSINPISTVDVDLSDNTDLLLEFNINAALDEAVLNSLKLSVNGQNIPFTFTSTQPTNRLYSAIIPRSVLIGHSPRTQLMFKIDRLVPVPDAPVIELGFALHWLRIRPA